MTALTDTLGTLTTLVLGASAVLGGAALTLVAPRYRRGTSTATWIGAVLVGIGLSIFAAGIVGGGA